MFLGDFEQQTSLRHPKPKTAKKQYSAGFKNYHPQRSATSYDVPALSEDDHLFAQLKIGNLRQLYLESLPLEDNSKIKKDQQQMSIARLTEVPKKQPAALDNEQEQQIKQTKAQLQAKFMKAYHRVDDYEEKANRKLFRSEFEKIKAKVGQVLKKRGKSNECQQVLAGFLLDRAGVYKDKVKINNDELLLDLTNFINQSISSPKDQEIKVQQLQQILRKNLFLFALFDIRNNEERYITQQKLRCMVKMDGCDDQSLQWEVVEKLLCKKITVPYQSQLYQSHNQSTRFVSPAQQTKQQNQAQKFHATAIPKTTYQRPKQRPKSQMAKTKPQPFNLTITTSKVPKMQDLYNWDRSVHPRQVPQTTYKPNKIKLMSQQQKKKRALGLLHEAEYPSTMKYLNNYNEEQQRKKVQLQNKYTKDRRMEQIRDVPNFQLIHKKNMQQMEEVKIERQELTKPQPFNLSQPRKAKEPIIYSPAINQEERIDTKIKNIFKQPKVKPASTLKFDSYVDYLKKKKEQKIQKEQNIKKQQMKKDKMQFKEILKNRVLCEIGKVPKNNLYPQSNLPSNAIKVNLENIYHTEPLLMQREGAKNKQHEQQLQKNWQPII